MAEQTLFEVGDTVCLKSCESCRMTVLRIPTGDNPDLLKPLQVECVWLDKNYQAHFSRFPVAMVQHAGQRQPLGFKQKR